MELKVEEEEVRGRLEEVEAAALVQRTRIESAENPSPISHRRFCHTTHVRNRAERYDQLERNCG